MSRVGTDPQFVWIRRAEPVDPPVKARMSTTKVPQQLPDLMSQGRALKLKSRSEVELGLTATQAPGANPIGAITAQLNGIQDDEAFCREAGRSLLGREMEPGAIKGWMEGMANGVPRSEIVKLIVGSPEFFNKANRAGLPAMLDGVPLTIPGAGAAAFSKLDYDPRTITANGGPDKIPSLMNNLAPFVNAMMVENPLKFAAERFPGSPAFKQAYELGRAMEDEFSSAGNYQSVGQFTQFAQSRIDQLKEVRAQMDPSLDAMNFPAIDKTIQIIEAAKGRALKGGTASLSSTGQRDGYYTEPYGRQQLGVRVAGDEGWAQPGKAWSPPPAWVAYAQTLIGGIQNS